MKLFNWLKHIVLPLHPIEIHCFLLIPANDILGRKNEIKDCIAAAEMERAVKHLIDFTRDFQPESEDVAVMISLDYWEWIKEYKEFEAKCKAGNELIISNTCEEKHGKLIMGKKHIALRIFTTLNTTTAKRVQA